MTTVLESLDDLAGLVGADLGSSPWFEIDQGRIDTFADATDDHQWIHVDPHRAKDGPFGTPIAHGYLTLSLLIPMFSELLDVRDVTTKVNYGLNKVRFPSPVPVGSKLRARAMLASPCTGTWLAGRPPRGPTPRPLPGWLRTPRRTPSSRPTAMST